MIISSNLSKLRQVKLIKHAAVYIVSATSDSYQEETRLHV